MTFKILYRYFENHKWITEMEIDGPIFVPKSGYSFTNLGESLSKKVGFLLPFEPILQAGFLDKMLALLSKKSAFVIVSGFSGCCNFTVLPKYHLVR